MASLMVSWACRCREPCSPSASSDRARRPMPAARMSNACTCADIWQGMRADARTGIVVLVGVVGVRGPFRLAGQHEMQALRERQHVLRLHGPLDALADALCARAVRGDLTGV